jgi:hypothetical protein
MIQVFPCPVRAGETLGGEKRLFFGEDSRPDSKLNRDTARVRHRGPRKNKILGNAGINRNDPGAG